MANDRMRAWLTRPGGLATELIAARGALSMRQMADRLGNGWTSARISKLEHGQQMPTAQDLNAIADGMGVSAEVRTAWQELLDEAMQRRPTFAKRTRSTTTAGDNLALTLEAEASYIRVTGPYVVPELLQTAAYAAEVSAASGMSKSEATQIVKELIERQRILADLERAFQFLIPESAMRTIPGSVPVVVGQLDRLISAAAMSNVQIAVLPLMEPVQVLPLTGTVAIYDGDAVIDDGVEQRHYRAGEAAQIVERMDELWRVALRGTAARKRIIEVVTELTAD